MITTNLKLQVVGTLYMSARSSGYKDMLAGRERERELVGN